jgi:membrane protein
MARRDAAGGWQRLRRALHAEVWQRDLSGGSRGRRIVVVALRVASLAGRGFGRHQLFIRAAALTYITIFGLVPVLAVAFAVFAGFGGLEQARAVLMPRLMEYIAVGSQRVVEARINEFVDNVRGGTIGSVATVFLILSVVFLLAGMEDTFNHIWEHPRARSFFRRITAYWTMVTVTPLLLLAAVTLPRWVERLAPSYAVFGTGVGELVFSVVLPVVFVWLGFTLVYFFVPNARVSPRAAVTGAVVGGSLWWVAVYGYTLYAGVAVAYSRIYGSLGVLPVFFAWIYVTWVVVLFGAEVASSVQHLPTSARDLRAGAASPVARELLALRVMAAVSRRFLDGTTPARIEDLAREVRAPASLVEEAVVRLKDGGLLVETEEGGGVVPARDPNRISPADLRRALGHLGEGAIWHEKDRTTREIEALQEQADEAARHVLGRVSLAQLALAGAPGAVGGQAPARNPDG